VWFKIIFGCKLLIDFIVIIRITFLLYFSKIFQIIITFNI